MRIFVSGKTTIALKVIEGTIKECPPFLKSKSHFFFFGGQGHPGRARGAQGKASLGDFSTLLKFYV